MNSALLGWFCGTIAAALIAIPRGAFSTVPEVGVVWLTASVTFVLALSHFELVRRSGRNPWTSIVVLTNLYYFYRFGLGVLVIYYWDRIPWELSYMQLRFFQQDARLELANSCHLILLGGVGLAAGSLLPATRRDIYQKHWWCVDYASLRFRLPLALPLVVAAFYLTGALQVLGVAMGFCGYVLIIIASCLMFDTTLGSERFRWLVVVLASAACAIPIGFLSGQLGFVVAPPLMMLFGFLLRRGRMPWKTLTGLALAAIIFLFPYLTAYKTAAYTRGAVTIQDRIELTQAQLEALGERAALELTMDRFVARMAQSLPAVFYRYYPDVYPYELGRTFGIEITSLVPRFVWPDKPSMSYELNRYTVRVGMITEGQQTSAVFDAVSEYYINFGMLGVLGMCGLHAWYLKVLGELFHAKLHWLVAGALNFGLFMTNPEFFGIVQVMVSHTRIVPVWLLMLYLLSHRDTPTLLRVPAYRGGMNYRAVPVARP